MEVSFHDNEDDDDEDDKILGYQLAGLSFKPGSQFPKKSNVGTVNKVEGEAKRYPRIPIYIPITVGKMAGSLQVLVTTR